MSSGLYSGVSGIALGTGLYRNVSGLWSGASGLVTGYGGGSPYGGASLYLDFLTMTAPTFDSRITFTRGTNATLTDSTGKITYAPTNQLARSQEFDTASWVKLNASVAANSATAPDGTLTADTVTATAGNARVYQFSTFIAATYQFSIWLRRVSGTGAVQGAQGDFSYTTLPVTSSWERFSFSRTVPADTNTFSIRIVTSGDVVEMWGAQLEPVTYQTTPGTYQATTSSAYYGPRFDYDPVTLALKGLLIEDQEVNLLTYSAEFDNAAWVKSNATVTANVSVAPDGTVSADRLIPGSTFTDGRVIELFTGSIGVTYTLTVYGKADAFSNIRLFSDDGATNTASVSYNLSTGAVSTAAAVAGTWTSVSTTSTAVGNGWYRLSLTWTATGAAPTRVAIWCRDTGDGTSGIYIWGAQLETSAYASSYIPTVASTVSRGADSVYITGTNFSSWYNQSEGTLVTSSIALSTASGRVASVNSGSFANSVIIGNGTGQIYSGGVSQGYIATASSAGVISKQALVYATNDMAYVQNGGTVFTDTTITLPVGINQLSIGNSGGGAAIFGGHIRELAYFNSRQANATLQTLTAPSTVPSLTLDFTSGSYSVGY